MVQQSVVIGSWRKILPFKPSADVVGYKSVNYGKRRNGNDHSHKPEKSAKQEDGKKNPEAWKAGRVSQNLWPKNISVKLLEHQYKNQEVQTFQRAYQQNEKGAGNRAEKRPEKGDYTW